MRVVPHHNTRPGIHRRAREFDLQRMRVRPVFRSSVHRHHRHIRLPSHRGHIALHGGNIHGTDSVVNIRPVAIRLVLRIREETEANPIALQHRAFVRQGCGGCGPHARDPVFRQPS